MRPKNIQKLVSYFITFMLIGFISNCSEKSVQPEEEQAVTISPEGGVYTFADGIKLRVPAGAVTENKDITLRKIDKSQLTSIYNQRGLSIDNLLACIEGKPDGMVFNYPVQLILTVDFEEGEIPVVHEVDLSTGSYSTIETKIICDPNQDTLVISLTHFSSIFAEILREIKQFFGGCGEEPCRCERYEVEQGDKDYLCDNGNCQITETKLFVTYLDCPGQPVEECFLREISAGCSLSLNLTATNTTITTGGATSIRAQVNLGCEPVEGQSVDFSIVGPATLNPTYSTTNADGEAFSALKAGEDKGLATVRARSTASYYTYTISASAGSLQESAHGPQITKELNENLEIEIIEPDQVWSGNIDFEVFTTFTAVLEHAKYSMDYTMFVSPANVAGERTALGLANASQEVTLAIGDGCWEFHNLNAPNTLELIIDGSVLGDTSSLFMSLRKFDESQFYEYTSCLICVVEPPPICSDGAGFVTGLLLGNQAFDELIIPLVNGTYSSSYSWEIISHPTGISPTINHIYTITLNREQ